MTVNSDRKTPQDRRTARPQDCITKYVRNRKTISGRLHDELVMMDLDQGKYFSLNPIATRIWDLLEKPHDVSELCVILTDEYEVDQARCAAEVTELLEEMVKLGLVLESREQSPGSME